MTPLGENYREYHTEEKRAWGPGLWQEEPDKAQWIDGATGLDCLIVRNRLGALCGYVGVSPAHPVHAKHYDDVDVRVHGGLTYADRCQPGDEAHAICHLPAPGRPDDLWWLGFDCAHFQDVCPSMRSTLRDLGAPRRRLDPEETYRDWAYVAAEVADLARQLAEQDDRTLMKPGFIT